MCESKFCQQALATSSTTSPVQIKVTELESYSRPMCNKLCASSHDALDRRRGNPQAPSSTSFVDHSIDLPWWNFLSPEFGAKFQREVPWFLEIPEFPYNKHTRIGQMKLHAKKTRLYPLFRCYTSLWRTDRLTDGRTDRYTTTAYRISIASRGKMTS